MLFARDYARLRRLQSRTDVGAVLQQVFDYRLPLMDMLVGQVLRRSRHSQRCLESEGGRCPVADLVLAGGTPALSPKPHCLADEPTRVIAMELRRTASELNQRYRAPKEALVLFGILQPLGDPV